MQTRPIRPALRLRLRWATGVAALAFAAGAFAGCANPNLIGVQDYGYIVGNVTDQNSKPVAGALVSATGTTTTSRTDDKGNFNLQNVAIGEQTVTIQAAGYGSGTATAIVVKNQGVTVPTVTIKSTLPGS
jgi:hypothetical protein